MQGPSASRSVLSPHVHVAGRLPDLAETELAYIDLSWGGFFGNLSAFLPDPGAAPNLRVLSLFGNSLNGTLPAGVARAMPGLTFL